jgi:hypothetical protein
MNKYNNGKTAASFHSDYQLQQKKLCNKKVAKILQLFTAQIKFNWGFVVLFEAQQ